MTHTPPRIEVPPYPSSSRWLLEISFDGTNYSGWQYQHHCISVQEVLQKHLSNIFADLPINLTGSSRTDAGVHALGMAASFAVPDRPSIEPDKLLRAMNRMLPPDIRIRKIKTVPVDFNPRFDSLGKAYTYVLNLGRETPFSTRYSWYRYRRLDIDAMREAAAHLIGTHDFSSFVVERSKIDDAVRTIYRIEFEQIGNFLCISFVGNGFLYKMIRCLVGLLESVGAGLRSPDDALRVLEARDRSQSAETAPPHGLFLMKVFFEEAPRNSWKLKNVPFFI